MPLKNLVYNTFPAVAHMPGRYLPNNACSMDLFKSLKATPEPEVLHPKGLSIVTWNNWKSRSILEEQCERMGLGLTILGGGIEKWVNGMKGPLLIEFARSSNSEFILALDAFDVSIQGELGVCIDEINALGCDALFGGECPSYAQKDETITQFESERYAAPWRYLNSGMMVARREFIAGLPDFVWDENDQTSWRNLHMEFYPKIRIDDHCKVFQNMNVPGGGRADRHFTVLFKKPLR